MARLAVFLEHVLPSRDWIDESGRLCRRGPFDTASTVGERDVRRDPELTPVPPEIPSTPEQGERHDRPHEQRRWLSSLDRVTWLTPDSAVQALDLRLEVRTFAFRGVAGGRSR
jgi:hypothetical protein